MSLLAKKLLLVALWCGVMWIIWSPSSGFNGLSLGREGKTEHFGFVGWFYVSVGRSRPYAEGVRMEGIVIGIGVTVLVSLFVWMCCRRLEKAST